MAISGRLEVPIIDVDHENRFYQSTWSIEIEGRELKQKSLGKTNTECQKERVKNKQGPLPSTYSPGTGRGTMGHPAVSNNKGHTLRKHWISNGPSFTHSKDQLVLHFYVNTDVFPLPLLQFCLSVESEVV
ncbi:hypothetical protein CEXT_122721 [Caerostris extrusa]|uniref:Uncharacterized protein n=1 Tax=Caerostris extrusa TaxID=172846 RepID=A0AAV4V1G8_CAEEX|nr:hypothetical protein CEXT_122721 [Caerostris extrusa]